MKLHTYNYIKQCLEMGHTVRVDYKATDGQEKYYICHRQEELPNYEFASFTDCVSVKVIPRPPKLLQPGEKCVVLDTEETRRWAEDNKWSEYKEGILGTSQTVLGIDDSSYRIRESGVSRTWWIPCFMIAPVPPEENKLANVDTEEMVKELESRGLLVDGKVLK